MPPITLRVFISSTFRDMHSERDYLTRFVFPELRERCLKKGIHLVDVDLRWGVTEAEAEQGKALEICLDEIENCRPFFIGILGERYGWVPPDYPVPDYPQYDWVKEMEKGHSITALEIYHGVLKNPEMRPRAFFYFRDPGFTDDVPMEKRPEVMAENPEAANKLYHLREDIRETFRAYHLPGHIMENYPCGYKGISIHWAQTRADLDQEIDTGSLQLLEELAGSDNLIDKEEYQRLNPEQRQLVNSYGAVCLEGLETFGQAVLHDL